MILVLGRKHMALFLQLQTPSCQLHLFPLAWHLMKGEFVELCKWSLDREGCRKTQLFGRCSFESLSALSLTHIPGRHRRLRMKSPVYPFTCQARLSVGWSPQRRDTGTANQLPHSDGLCLCQSLLGLLYFKANSCLFCLNVLVVFFLKVLAICLTFSHPCWDLRSSSYFTTWSWQAPLVEIQTEATWWGNRHKNINLVDIKKNHAGYKSEAVHWFLSSSKWSF